MRKSTVGQGQWALNCFRIELVLRTLLSYWFQGLGLHGLQRGACARAVALLVPSNALPCTEVTGAIVDEGNSLNLAHACPDPEATICCPAVT
jgi:hypothetical protein